MPTSASSSPAAGTSSTKTSASTSTSSGTLSADVIVGIVVGAVFAVIALTALVIFLVRRRQLRRSGFERVDNPRRLRGVNAASGERSIPSLGTGITPPEPRIRDKGLGKYMGHSQQQSVSLEPLLPTTARDSLPRVHSPRSPFRPGCEHSDGVFGPDQVELGVIHDEYDPYAEFDDSAAVASPGGPPIPNTPPVAHRESTLNRYTTYSRVGNGDQIHRGMKSSRTATEPDSPRSRTPLFISRTLKKHPDGHPSAPVTGHNEQTGLLTQIDAPDSEQIQPRWPPPETHRSDPGFGTEGKPLGASILTQPFTKMHVQVEHLLVPPIGFTPGQLVRPQRKLTRTRTHSPGFSGALPSVAETPDLSQVLDFVTPQPPSISTSSESQLDSTRDRSSSVSANVSHDVVSTSSAATDEKLPIPLLASTSFGRGNLTPTPTSSNSSNIGCNTSSGSSRYPSLAASSLGQCSGSRPHSGGHTDWHHPPSGLAGLKDLHIEPLRNPHSPVETTAPPFPAPSSSVPFSSPSDTVKRGDTVKRAHLRENTSSSVTEIQQRSVSQGGIAAIDITI
ncbi:hypothetical protein V8B97DRAFT_1962772 [Scleroderma yunnanense]